jgi:hypothetical protein
MKQLNKENNYLSIVAVLGSSATKESIDNFITFLIGYCDNKFKNFEFVFVDNNSSKNVINALDQRFHNTAYNVNIITLPFTHNKEAAILSGIDASIGDYVFEFEDLIVDYTTSDLDAMYNTCLSGSDMVFLKKKNSGSFFEKTFYKILVKHSNKNSVLHKSRVHLISRRGLNRVNSMNKIIHYRKYVYCNSGLQYVFVEYDSTYESSEAGLSFDKIDFATDLLLIFTGVGKKISIFLSLFFAIVSILSLVYTILAFIMINTISGWATMMILISLSFTGIFISFGIIIKYLDILLKLNHQNESTISSKRRV